jgi:hypothetical protein
MPEANKVIAHYLNGTLVKGTTHDFFPTRATFHIDPVNGAATVEVACKTLKALFFVRDYAGSPERNDLPGFISGPSETAHGKKVAVRFKDGELLCGYTLTYSPEREGFFVFPSDAQSNNLRVYVLTAATATIKIGPAAEAFAQQSLSGGGAARS